MFTPISTIPAFLKTNFTIIEKINILINFSRLLYKSENFNFVKDGKSIIKIGTLATEHLWNDIDIYCNEGIIYWIDNEDKTYYAFKFKDIEIRCNIKNFLKNITPIRKKLNLNGYRYKNIHNYFTKILPLIL